MKLAPTTTAVLGRSGRRQDCTSIGKGAKIKDARGAGQRDIQADRLCARRQQQGAVSELPAVVDEHDRARRVDCGYALIEQQIDFLIDIVLRAAQRHPFLGRSPCQKILGEIGAIIRRHIIRAHHGHRTGIPATTQHVRGGQRRRPASSNDHGGRRLGAGCTGRLAGTPWERQFFANENLVAHHLDAPTGNGIKGGRIQRFAAAQVEAGVMQRAADRIANDQSFGQRAVVVRACRADGKVVLTAPHQDGFLAIDASADDPALPDFRNGQAGLQIDIIGLLHA